MQLLEEGEEVKIETWPLAKITPYARNPRINEGAIATVRASLKEYGWQQPIVVDEEGVILAGHTRYRAALDLGWTEAPVQIAVGLSSAQAKGYRLMDNKSHEKATWDLDLLSFEIDELKELNFNLELTGFSLDELPDPLSEKESGEAGEIETLDDQIAEIAERWQVKPGQLWRCGPHRILCGDSTNPEDVTKLLGQDRPFLCVTDPPYGVRLDPSWRNETHSPEVAPKRWSRAVAKVINDDNADWSAAWKLFPGDVIYAWAPPGADQIVHALALQEAGFDLRMQIVWAKNHFAISRSDYQLKHENCWYAVRKGKSAQFTEDRTQTTLWEIAKNQKLDTGHSAQKPLECMARPIRNHTAEAIYDPFLGSGTTLVACHELGRRCLGMELHPPYVALALQRYETLTQTTPELDHAL